jgi:hypothetical protein
MSFNREHKKLLFPSLLFCTILGRTFRSFAKLASIKLMRASACHVEIASSIGQQNLRLNFPVVFFAIIECDKIMNLRGFGLVPDRKLPSFRHYPLQPR